MDSTDSLSVFLLPHGLIVDGIEDWELFNRLGNSLAPTMISNADDLITQLISNITLRNEDPTLLETARRQAAHHHHVGGGDAWKSYED